jgi:hypothetical protein
MASCLLLGNIHNFFMVSVFPQLTGNFSSSSSFPLPCWKWQVSKIIFITVNDGIDGQVWECKGSIILTFGESKFKLFASQMRQNEKFLSHSLRSIIHYFNGLINSLSNGNFQNFPVNACVQSFFLSVTNLGSF